MVRHHHLSCGVIFLLIIMVHGKGITKNILQKLPRLSNRQLGCYDRLATTSHPAALGATFQSLDSGCHYADHVSIPVESGPNVRTISNSLFLQPSCDDSK